MSYRIKVELPFDMANKDDRALFDALQDGMCQDELDLYIKKLLREALKATAPKEHDAWAGNQKVLAMKEEALKAQPSEPPKAYGFTALKVEGNHNLEIAPDRRVERDNVALVSLPTYERLFNQAVSQSAPSFEQEADGEVE